MLPDKNELNNEIIEQISGGGSSIRILDPLQGVNPTQEVEIKPATAQSLAGMMESSCVPLHSGKQFPVTEQHTDSQSSKYETQIIPKIAPVGGDLKTAIPSTSNKDGLVKIH